MSTSRPSQPSRPSSSTPHRPSQPSRPSTSRTASHASTSARPTHPHSHSHASHRHPSDPARTNDAAADNDEGPPTAGLRSRNVTGSRNIDFPEPGTPRSGGASEGTVGRGVGASGEGWRLPGVKGTIGGISSPGRGLVSPSLTASSATAQEPLRSPQYDPAGRNPSNDHQNGAEHNNGHSARPPRAIAFRTDPTLGSCLDTLNLERKDEIRRLFGVV